MRHSKIRCSEHIYLHFRPPQKPVTITRHRPCALPIYRPSSPAVSCNPSQCPWPLAEHNFRLKGHLLLDLRDRQPGIQALRARPRAVQDGVAPVHAHAVVQRLLALLLLLISRVREPSVALQQDGRAEVLLAVPPVARARGRAARAQDALVQPVQLPPVLLRLQVLLAIGRGS